MENKKKKRILIIIVAMVILVAIVVAVSRSALDRADYSALQKTSVVQQNEAETDAVNYTEIKTKYASLYINADYQDSLIPEIKGDTLAFRTELNGKTYTVFTLKFSKAEGYIRLGTFIADDGTQTPLYVKYSAEEASSLNSEDRNQFYAMGEEINTVIDKLSQTNGFENG